MELSSKEYDLLSYFLSIDLTNEDILSNIPKNLSLNTNELIETGTDPQELLAVAQSAQTIPFDSILNGKTRREEDDEEDNPSKRSSNVRSDDKRQRRLARNRESARQSRRRKKQYLELLEEKVAQLTEAIDITRANHLEQANEALDTAQSTMIRTLMNTLESDFNEGRVGHEKLRQGLQLLRDRFGPNSAERTAVKDYNFRQLDHLLLPPYCRFLLWLSIQEDSFFECDHRSNPHTNIKSNPHNDTMIMEKRMNAPGLVKKDKLWPALVSELGLTYEQDEKLRSLYTSQESKSLRTERKRAAFATAYLSKLKSNLEARAAAVQSQMDKVHSILTPEQSIRYMHWLDTHRDTLLHKFEPIGLISTQGIESDTIRSILDKNDHDLTVEDVAALLNQL